ncbi:MAG: tRNA lysidine(34) synthetase TilS [Taibaiella sp.]|jgi:tRNA(Ile)-lysidine synthase
MQEKLQAILSERQWINKKIIVAVSGGSDSMVLAALLKNAGSAITIAHCNFGLRGTESDGDEALVRHWTDANEVPLFVQKFDTQKILEDQGGNLQETARNLRYDWFEQLRKEQGYDLIATAHHKQDSVETMLINFFKGTGISGMHGILPQQNKIIRPLLSFTKEEIQQFAQLHNILWREDSSNAKDQYTRNAIRLKLLPVMEQIFPQALENLAGNTIRFREAEMLYNESIERYRRKLIEQRNKDWYIPILKLKHVSPLSTILWELIRPFEFNAAQLKDVVHLIDAETGKYVSSPAFRIIRNRDFLIITALQQKESTHILIQEDDRKIEASTFTLYMKHASYKASDMDRIKQLPKEEACLDANTLQFPLVLRPWKTGDYFYPMGMNRKKKKVSRFLIEQKMPLHEKEQVWVLESGKKIVWVIGMRPDERFKINAQTAKCVYFSVNK